MSGQAVNRNLCAKHIPVVVNAIKKLEKQVTNNGIKQLVIKNVKFTPNAYWKPADEDPVTESGQWQVSKTNKSAPKTVMYSSDRVWFSDEICNKLRALMSTNSIVSLRLNIPLNDNVLNELSANQNWINHYTAEYTNGIYPYVFQFAGCKWDFINFSYMAADAINITITVNVKGESQRDQMVAAGGNISSMTPGIRITDVNRYYPDGGQFAFDFNGEQTIYNGAVRIAIPEDPIDIIIEYRE
jgi:hypothetical protein